MYIDNMLDRFNVTNGHPASAPVALRYHASLTFPNSLSMIMWTAKLLILRMDSLQAAAALLWLARCTFPHMLYAVNTHRFGSAHVTAVLLAKVQ
jgi:hypothetical protein